MQKSIYILIFFIPLLSMSQKNHKYLDVYSGLVVSKFVNQSRTLSADYSYTFNPFLKASYMEFSRSGFGYKLDGGYAMKGSYYDVKDVFSNKYTFHYLDLTAMGVYGFEIIPFGSIKNALISHFGLGINFGIPLFSSSSLSIQNSDYSEEYIRNNYPLLGEKDPVSEGKMKPVNASLSLELGFRYRILLRSMINLLIRYDHGLYNIEREESIPTRTYGRDFYIGLGYTFIIHNT